MPATASAPCFSVLSSALLLSQLTGLQSSARRRGGGGGLAAPAVALGQGWNYSVGESKYGLFLSLNHYTTGAGSDCLQCSWRGMVENISSDSVPSEWLNF